MNSIAGGAFKDCERTLTILTYKSSAADLYALDNGIRVEYLITPGDLDGDEKITDKDAIYLLMHSYFPEDYPVNQPLDYNNDGLINDKDAIYLLMHCYFPEDYPITK